jgi:hypothetical protein
LLPEKEILGDERGAAPQQPTSESNAVRHNDLNRDQELREMPNGGLHSENLRTNYVRYLSMLAGSLRTTGGSFPNQVGKNTLTNTCEANDQIVDQLSTHRIATVIPAGFSGTLGFKLHEYWPLTTLH